MHNFVYYMVMLIDAMMPAAIAYCVTAQCVNLLPMLARAIGRV